MAVLAILVVLAACATPNAGRPVTPAPTVPAETGLPQAPPAMPTKPVTETPLGPPGQAAAPATGPLKVGLLLPLSGNGATVGTEMLNAAQMALFDLGEDRFQLLPRDTKGSPAEAAGAARGLIAGGARLLLGPLFSAEVTAVKPVAQGAGVSVLAFSNDWTRAGDGTFIVGLVPADQVARIVGFAQLRGLARLAVLAPRDPYGEAVLAAVHDTAATTITIRSPKDFGVCPSCGTVSRCVQAALSARRRPAALRKERQALGCGASVPLRRRCCAGVRFSRSALPTTP